MICDVFVFFFFKQKTAYEIGVRLVGSEMCIRDRVDGVLQALFALLTLTVIASAIPIWIKAARLGGLPTIEVPRQPSHLVAPAEIFATAQEKKDVREYEDSQRKLAASGRSR